MFSAVMLDTNAPDGSSFHGRLMPSFLATLPAAWATAALIPDLIAILTNRKNNVPYRPRLVPSLRMEAWMFRAL